MKRMLLAIALMGLVAGAAYAQPSNLAGGVFIVHYPPGLQYCVDTGDYCAQYDPFAISSCEEQNPRVDTGLSIVWYVLGAFNEADKVWCGTEFGFGTFDPAAFVFIGYGQCPTDALVIPTAGWPGPGTGIAIAATATPWSGNFRPVYWFAGYAYYPGLVPLGVNPATAFGGFANCLTPPTAYPAACFGALGLYQDGVACCPQAPVTHACCVGPDCVLVYTADECLALGGIDHPEWPTCEGDPCYPIQPTHVCCIGLECVLLTEEDCALMGGIWLPQYDECFSQVCGGTPVEPTTWGAIKSIYR